MPELPEVEAVCRKLRREAIGARIETAKIQRKRITAPQDPVEAEMLAAGTTIDRIDRRAKNIQVRLSSGLTIHVHLRMTGNLYVIPDHRLRPVATSAWFGLADGRALLFEDTRGLGTLQVRADAPDDLGPEPLSRAFTPDVLIRAARSSKQPAKLFLLDQRRIAGLGNIYAAEALHAARINPKRPICRNSDAKLAALHSAIVCILRDAVKSACIAYSRPGRFREAESFSLAVYDREGEACPGCGCAIRRITQGGRSTYYCPHCQR